MATGSLPAGLLNEVNAVRVEDDLSDLCERLNSEVLAQRLRRAGDAGRPGYQFSETPEEHASEVESRARQILDMDGPAHVREEGGLSSFCIPAAAPNSPVWADWSGQLDDRSYLHRQLRGQRLALEEHARSQGCSLIIYPAASLIELGPKVWRTRASLLTEFLESMEDDAVRVALQARESMTRSIILGDWFAAKSIFAGVTGSRSICILTTHPPTVGDYVGNFDRAWQEIAESSETSGLSSRQRAIAAIREIDAQLARGPATISPLSDAPKVFISAKSEDYSYAEHVYNFLTQHGVSVFFSKVSLPNLRGSDYRKAIDKALDQTQHMIVVASSEENADASWVEAEWGFFINEKRSGRKAGNLITVMVGGLEPSKLPASLRTFEALRYAPPEFEKILRYVD
ncbi:MAG: hypothetical protein BWX88_00589 [Planctomycetes bacterium ADurb.Bin126]|nr:MAG: hypothetical protein BWX88_00589 [Planctomycetes bacterium ADurb.Bin126]